MSQQSGEHAYRVAAWWTSERSGLAKSDSAPNAVHFTAPKSLVASKARWTPEELLLAALAGCFTTTLRAVAGSGQFDSPTCRWKPVERCTRPRPAVVSAKL